MYPLHPCKILLLANLLFLNVGFYDAVTSTVEVHHVAMTFNDIITFSDDLNGGVRDSLYNQCTPNR